MEFALHALVLSVEFGEQAILQPLYGRLRRLRVLLTAVLLRRRVSDRSDLDLLTSRHGAERQGEQPGDAEGP